MSDFVPSPPEPAPPSVDGELVEPTPANPPVPAVPPTPTSIDGAFLPFLFLLSCVALVALRETDTTIGDWLERFATLRHADERIKTHAMHALSIPVGAVAVVFIRLTLGLRMLGPFRPILIALAFQYTGIVPGMIVLAGVWAIVSLIRPRLRGSLLPYYSRLGVLLTLVVLLMTVILLIGEASESSLLRLSAFFPVVVLCLSADGLARSVADDGIGVAVYRGATTVLIAVGIYYAVSPLSVQEFLLGHPELALGQIGVILLISKYLDFKLFEGPEPDPATATAGDGL